MSHDHHHNCDHDHDHDHSDSEDTHLTLYTPPTPLIFLRATAINLILPFINGLMLGFGELFAHEIAFRWGWGGTRVCALSMGVGWCARLIRIGVPGGESSTSGCGCGGAREGRQSECCAWD